MKLSELLNESSKTDFEKAKEFLVGKGFTIMFEDAVGNRLVGKKPRKGTLSINFEPKAVPGHPDNTGKWGVFKDGFALTIGSIDECIKYLSTGYGKKHV